MTRISRLITTSSTPTTSTAQPARRSCRKRWSATCWNQTAWSPTSRTGGLYKFSTVARRSTGKSCCAIWSLSAITTSSTSSASSVSSTIFCASARRRAWAFTRDTPAAAGWISTRGEQTVNLSRQLAAWCVSKLNNFSIMRTLFRAEVVVNKPARLL